MAGRKQATPAEIQQLKSSLKKLKPERDLYFLYFDHSEDNAPILLIEKARIAGERLKSLTSSAKKKKPIKGLVRLSAEDGRVEFRPFKAPGKLQRALKKFYKQLPQLKSARVVISQDKASVEMQMGDAREVSAEKGQAAEEVRAQLSQLETELGLLEAEEAKAEQELSALEAEGSSMWNFMRNRRRTQQLVMLKEKKEARKWVAEEARKRRRALTEQLTLAELERQQAEEDASDLKEMWSLIQQREWEARQRSDADWREEIEANMDLLSAKTEAAEILGAYVLELERELLGQEVEERSLQERIKALEEERSRTAEGTLSAEQASELEQLKQRLQQDTEQIVQLQQELEGARENAERAERESLEARDERNRVFMTQDRRERSVELRGELSAAEESVERTALALREASEHEAAANESLRAVNETAAQVEQLRLAVAAADFDVADLKKRSAKWSYGRSSRRKDSKAAADDLPEAQARAAQLRQELDAALLKLTTLETAAAGALEEARGATAARLERQAEASAAERSLALIQQEVAEEEATVEEWACDLRRKKLARQIEQDPELREARAVKLQREEAASKSAEALLEQTAALSELRARNEALQREMAGFNQVLDPQLTTEYADNLNQITKLAQAVEAARGRAEESCRQAESAAAQFEQALAARCRDSRVLDDARSALEQSERALDQAAQRDLDAIMVLESADEQSAEVSREGAVYGLIIDGEAMVRANGALFERLRGQDLFNSSDVQAVRAAVGPAADKLLAELDKHAYQMIQAGATAKELAQVFERVPNGLRPAAYRDEVVAVDTLMHRFEELEALQTQEDRDEYLIKTAHQPSKEELCEQIKTLLGQLDTQRKKITKVTGQVASDGGRMQGWLTMLGAVDPDSASQQQLTSLLKVLGQVNRANARLNTGISAAKAFSAENEDEDPVLQKIQDQEKLDALNGLANAGLDVAQQFVPVLLTARQGRAFIEGVVQSASRTYKASYDAKLKAIAKVHGSVLAGPLEESLGNELKLAERYGFNAALKAASITADVLKAGPQASIGFALAVAASNTAKAHNLVHDIISWKQAAKAKSLLERARAGDDKAKSLLLKHHARYAKGMLALKAQEGDPFAMQYVGSRGLSESDIRKSSLDIITRYLLKSAKQSGNGQTFDEWVSSKKASFARLSDVIAAPLRFSWRSIFGDLQEIDTIGNIEVPLLEVPLSQASELVEVVRDAAALRGRLLAREAPTEVDQHDQQKTIEKVTEMLAEQRRKGLRLRERAGEQIRRISKVEQTFQAQMSEPLELDSAQKSIMLGLQEHVPRIRMEHVELAGILTALV